jgi:8-oxo-dGTP pyrophosphatase MutT (NUDIX family)
VTSTAREAVDTYLAAVPDHPDAARLRTLLARDDAWARDIPLHLTASALVVHPPSHRVLLRWHERMQRWLQLGGHADPGETDPWAIALREAREESGLHDLRPLPPGAPRVAQVVIVPVPARGDEPAHEHADIRYLMATDRPDDATPETASAPLRWVPVDVAAHDVEEDSVRTLVERARDALDAR